MKKTRFTDNQIVNIPKQAEQGVPITELFREHNITQSAFYNWRSKYGGMDAALISRPMHRNTLTNCEIMVASAAPSTSILNTPMSRISSTTLVMEEMMR